MQIARHAGDTVTPSFRSAPAPDLGIVGNLERHVAKLATIGVQPDGSISRIAWTEPESAAVAYVRSEGEAFGLIGRYDTIGNLILSTPDEHPRRMLMGSHIDSVPHGGNYDGSAGILAGLEALRDLRREGVELATGIDLVIWRGEEYTYNAVYKGSATAFGMSESHILHNAYDGVTLRNAIQNQGFDPTAIDEGQPSFGREYIDAIVGYLELHIEQGVRLDRDRKDVAIVTSIAGDRRFLIVLEGRFDHSGATPMGVKFRSDVNLAMAYIQVELDKLAKKRRKEGHDFVQTVGIVNADPEIDRKYFDVHSNSVTKVSGLGYFTIDLMSPDDEFMDAYSAEMHRLIWQTAKNFGVKAVIEQTDSARGLAALDPTLKGHLESAIQGLGHSYLQMASGAGHDAAIVAEARRSDGSRIPVGMLFIPCRDGISHSGAESVEAEEIAKGAEVLRETLRELCTGS